MSGTIRVRRVARNEDIVEGLVNVTVDCVDGGASIGFMHPFDAADRLYVRRGWQRVGVIPGYALWPDGGPVDTTVFYKQLTSPPSD